MIKVLKPGLATSVQDLGREGYYHLGIPPSGALDQYALSAANQLVGNPANSAALECTLLGPELEFQQDALVAVCGAHMTPKVDGVDMHLDTAFAVKAGQVLRFDFPKAGARAYLAVAGGFRAAPVLGSVSAQQREGLGGLDGQGSPLQVGDRLPCGSGGVFSHPASVPWPYRPDYRGKPLLRVITGGDAASFDEDQLQGFFAQAWQLSPHSDRMGARLLGEPLQVPAREWSLGVGRGAIQVPPDGQPIILQADHQTMGGYPLLGWLHPLDQSRLAQCPAHQEVRFTPVSVSDAQAELREFYRFFRR